MRKSITQFTIQMFMLDLAHDFIVTSRTKLVQAIWRPTCLIYAGVPATIQTHRVWVCFV